MITQREQPQMFIARSSACDSVNGFHDHGNIPDIISWPMYIRIEFIPGKMNGDPDQNLGEDRNSYVMLSPLYARSLPVDIY